MSAPTEIYDTVIDATIEKANEALAAFFNSGARSCVQTHEGEWYAIDPDTYDGEPLALFETPLGAIFNWFEEVSA